MIYLSKNIQNKIDIIIIKFVTENFYTDTSTDCIKCCSTKKFDERKNCDKAGIPKNNQIVLFLKPDLIYVFIKK
ncbi:hypothetical protein DSL64_20080 [Dyadobacter luteus]|uniref:Uncharacterized protein n=1 Tax=Dyadobacter luteus TaxID=2259619 RepID=A0A3D8YA75_9BACT|nr:hypothetical protein DSL64_20080 [Dyadobacter luteus]